MKKGFLITLIASLSISALIAIGLFLFGSFNDTEAKVLLTTLVIGGYSLTSLCASALYDRKQYLSLAVSGLLVSIAGFVVSTLAIWGVTTADTIYKPIAVLTILAISIAHASLLFLAYPTNKTVTIAIIATGIFITAVALMVIYLILSQNGFGDAPSIFYRLLGVFAVLDVLGTILTPILKKVTVS